MSPPDLLPFQYPSSEIFVGLVGPVGSESGVAIRVIFEPFVGLAPRQYMSLFELGKIERKTADGRIKQWSAFEADTRMGQPSSAYLEKEQRFLIEFRTKLEALAGLASNPLESKGQTNDQG